MRPDGDKGIISRKGIVAGSFDDDGRVKRPAGIASTADCPAISNTSWKQTPIVRQSFLIRSLHSIQAINSLTIIPSWPPMQT